MFLDCIDWLYLKRVRKRARYSAELRAVASIGDLRALVRVR